MATRSVTYKTTEAGTKFPAFPSQGLMSDIQYYEALRKTANRRQRNLEKVAQSNEMYDAALGFGYRKAQWGIKGLFGEDVTRFQKINPENKNLLRKAIKEAEEFVNSPTSTIQGITNIYKHEVDVINEKYGSDFTWEEWAELMRSGAWDDIKDKIGSKTALYSMKYVINGNNFDKAIENATKEKNEGNIPDRSTYEELSRIIAKRHLKRT